MRRKPFKPPYRQRNGDDHEPNRPNRRSGAIDQRLIEGAQVSSPFFSQFRTNGDGHQHRGFVSDSLGSGTYTSTGVNGGDGDGDGEGDMQLDAFGECILIMTVAVKCCQSMLTDGYCCRPAVTGPDGSSDEYGTGAIAGESSSEAGFEVFYR